MEYRKFELVSNYKPTGDQPNAIKELSDGIRNGKKIQVLLGATGTGKTFTVGNVIQEVQKPTLVLVHNKTLAAQLYAEFKELFPHNRVEYFVSNFDFYQPEAYLPKSDTYIDTVPLRFHTILLDLAWVEFQGGCRLCSQRRLGNTSHKVLLRRTVPYLYSLLPLLRQRADFLCILRHLCMAQF